ncbi:MsbA family ABC transporter, ATP-binding protein [Staphylococcus aureus M1423]|uniref:ABC superfamily ATP binding cassette transporter, ABC protein n=10 Tax=Staphylococcus aureus TaxID=1280 RepID=A0A3A5LH28_STAAU|nr:MULTISPECIES: ABC transporter ATP-binding protein/permease [Staphylococcus]EGL95831.1 ABC transporter, ATP-binding protein [Staphylococcus aureus subsp. aureus 21318]EHS10209.1 ABC transporter, ATP-binding protein [Staphylococcus aureus subsp. aureus IS-99]ENK67478.1 MsbA family ABC transporter, ATP-binding protein [Staphylococcus aureus M0562]EUY49414.1 MsbA family ABC transporter, ATP-binding protein [Staphylococcus aureus M0406]MBN4843488.1 ABC transporter ATP-binding protein/permease [S
MKKLTTILFQYKIFPVLMFLVSTGLGILVITQNILIADFLAKIIRHQFQGLWIVLFILLGVLLLRATVQFLNQWLGDTLAFKVKHMLRQRVIYKNNGHPIGEQMTILTENIDGLAPFYKSYLPQVFKSMMVPLIIIIAMFFIHFNTALIMLITAPFIPLFYIIFGLKTRDESKDQMTYLNQFSQRFLNIAKGLVTLKLFNRTEQTEKHIYDDSTQFRTLTMRILRSAFLSGLMLEFISMLGIGLVALEATLSLVVFHNIDFKTAAIAIILAPEFYNAIKDLGQAFHTGKQSEGASDVVFEFLEQPNYNNEFLLKYEENQKPFIQLTDISFRYDDSDRLVLNDLNLEIFKGDQIALVGPSGAGKSTLTHLIAGVYQPTIGTISTNQRDLNIGILSQQPYIFSASIKENITMFKDIENNTIEEVLDEVGLLDKVQSFTKGINTIIGEGGEMLSGGQMRRIELCRLLVMKPDLVIFDEPATGLDIQTEHMIQNVLFQHFKDTTMIVIAHRDNTIRHLQRRLYIENGRLIADDRNISVNITENGDDL